MPADISREIITIVAADGRKLSGRWWDGAQASERSLIFLPGLAAPQGYLGWFAAYLAGLGWGALTFDYRSVGASRDSASDNAVTLDDWVELDIPAAVSELRRRTKTQFLGVIAHSIGGQLLGQSAIRKEVDGVLLIAAQRGIPSLFKGTDYLRVQYAYALFSLLIRTLGYLPVSRFTLPEHCSGQALLQWINWGRAGAFVNAAGVNVESRFAEYQGPLVAVTIADDGYAPAAAVEALTSLYQSAAISRQTFAPENYGVKSIGHFGFFQRRAPRELWVQAATFLRRLEADAARRCAS